ncbi:MAG: hypothetical protein H6526_07235 [Actinobacteria bacterium]|nr:hypothetical protein [Actinomycetota bacterium]MCB8996617.1 hypothetical protein [Actinomycetota bacterium]MCB9415060.1 hypothetical protein [Actinomycetota bacterium]
MKTALAAAGAAALFALAGCSSSDTTESPAATSPAATASPEASMIGPIMVEPSQTEVDATVGRFLNFNVGDNPGQWQISSDNEAVVTVEQGGERDGATFNPGGEAVGVGEATVTLIDTEGGDALEFKIKVTE